MLNKDLGRLRRHKRIRKKIIGTPQRPRLVLRRSHKNLFAQLVDDLNGKTLVGMSSLSEGFRAKMKTGGNAKSASILGELMAQKAKEKGITKVVFDRGGYLYHGRIKAFAEEARKQGLEF
jgi:large subunit ribosomal protein L18